MPIHSHNPKTCSHNFASFIHDAKKVWQHLDDDLCDIAFLSVEARFHQFLTWKIDEIFCGVSRGKGCWSWQCLPQLLLELGSTPWLQKHLQMEQWHQPDTTWCSRWPMDPSDTHPGSKSAKPTQYRIHIIQIGNFFECVSKECDSNCDNEKNLLCLQNCCRRLLRLLPLQTAGVRIQRVCWRQ